MRKDCPVCKTIFTAVNASTPYTDNLEEERDRLREENKTLTKIIHNYEELALEKQKFIGKYRTALEEIKTVCVSGTVVYLIAEKALGTELLTSSEVKGEG